MMSSDDSSGSLNSNDSRCEKYSELKSRYKILRSIGKGNFAHVKSALHLDTKQHVAIKIINTKKLNEASIIKLEREIEIMKKINHRHIVKLIEVIRGKTYSYIVEELVNGGELFDFLLNSGRMREKDAKKTFYQLISAVLYCHNLKIVHRDLKAENILLDENHNVKLADFGFANFFSSEADLATCCGSPPYAAPELFQAKKYKGPEVDVWSLGVILFTLVTGSLPFDGSDINKMREKVLSGKFKIPFYVSHQCENLLKKMLCKDRSKRIALIDVQDSEWLSSIKQTRLQSLSNQAHPHDDIEKDLERFKILLTSQGIDYQKAERSIRNETYDQYHAYFIILHHFDRFRDIELKMKNQAKISNALYDTNRPAPDAYAQLASPGSPLKKQVASPTDLRVRNLPHDAKSGGQQQIINKRLLIKRAPHKTSPAPHSMNSGDNPNHEIKADEDLYNIPKVILEKSFHSSLYDSDYNSNIEQRMARNLRIKDIALNFNPNHKPHAKSPLAKQEVQATGDPNANDSKITKPRSVIITFNVKKVKIDDPRVILDILKKTLEKVNISYLHISLYNLNCVYSQANIKSIVFEIEIVKFKSKKSYGLKCKRLHGSAINYKTIIENIYTVFDAMK